MYASDRGIILAVVISVVLHFGAVIAFQQLSKGGPEVKIDKKSIATAVLVRKGKPRPRHLLPRIHQAPRAAVPKRRVVAERKKPPPRRRRKRKKRPSNDDIIRKAEKMMERYRRNRREPDDPRADRTPPPGVHDGSVDGTVSTRDLARLGSMYGLQLRKKIERRLEIPSFISDAEFRKFRRRIEIIAYLDRNGRLKSVKLKQPSGNKHVDNAVLNAIRSAAPYPKPPKKLRPHIREGIVISW